MGLNAPAGGGGGGGGAFDAPEFIKNAITLTSTKVEKPVCQNMTISSWSAVFYVKINLQINNYT